MTKSKPKANADIDYNARVQEAVDGIRSGIYKSSYQAAEALNVKARTIQGRMRGKKTRSDSHEDQKALSAIEELELVRWITQLTIAGYPAGPDSLKAMAEALIKRRVAQVNDDGIELVNYPPLGKGSYKRFRNRHPEIDTIIGTAIEMNRMKDTSKEVLQGWFDTFKSTMEFYNIEPDNVYNMDESGFSIGEIQASRVIVNTAVRQKYQAQPGRQEWVTAVEAICADGTAIPPLIIFKGESLPPQWISGPNVPHDWRFDHNQKGWTSNEHGLQWLRRCFEPCTREKANGKTRLLICDGHGSHVTPEFIIHCMFYNIVLLVLPPHTSHISQPLDVGVFKPLKTYLSAALHGLISSEIARLQKWEWLDKYATARKQATSEPNILSAFSTAGLFPFYPPKVLRRIPSPIEPETPADRTTPEPSVSPLEHPLLTSSPADMNVFRAANEFLKERITANPTLSPEERQHINRLRRSSEKFFTRSNLRAEENTALREIIQARKNRSKFWYTFELFFHCDGLVGVAQLQLTIKVWLVHIWPTLLPSKKSSQMRVHITKLTFDR
jgi:hypothetical protein